MALPEVTESHALLQLIDDMIRARQQDIKDLQQKRAVILAGMPRRDPGLTVTHLEVPGLPPREIKRIRP